MNCTQTQKLLSAYHDDELPGEQRQSVGEHIKACAACSAELAGFKNLAALADRLTPLTPPQSEWNRLEEMLDRDSSDLTRKPGPLWMLLDRRLFVVAATLLVAVGIGWSGYRMWSPAHKHTAVFGKYLAMFPQNPEKAQDMLLAKYEGAALDADDAVHTVGYRPAVADGLPDGYTIETTLVMEMPCCKCVQTLCRRTDGSALVLFEHGDGHQPDWFGGQTCTTATCGDQQCSVVGLDSQLAASWKRGKRHMTIVGARDIAEVDKMVAWLADDDASSS